VLATTIRAYAAAWAARDREAWLRTFATDATQEDPVGDPVRRGHHEIGEFGKWMGTPVWSQDGIICTGESYKNVVKLAFAKGASLKDPARLFNSSLHGNVRGALDIHEGEGS
jgi:SnoaL-like protein/uncharacterized protein DUF1801